MKKEHLLIFIGITLIGAWLWRQPLFDYFNGMGPLGAIQVIWQFVLHITVGTICAYVVIGLPAIAGPWIKTFQWKQKQMRRNWQSGPNAHFQQRPAAPSPRLSVQDKLLLALAGKIPTTGERSLRIPPMEANDDDDLRIEM